MINITIKAVSFVLVLNLVFVLLVELVNFLVILQDIFDVLC